MKIVYGICGIIVMCVALNGCVTMQQLSKQKREKDCLPGTDCWSSLPAEDQQMKRQQWMVEMQNREMLTDSTRYKSGWMAQPGNVSY